MIRKKVRQLVSCHVLLHDHAYCRSYPSIRYAHCDICAQRGRLNDHKYSEKNSFYKNGCNKPTLSIKSKSENHVNTNYFSESSDSESTDNSSTSDAHLSYAFEEKLCVLNDPVHLSPVKTVKKTLSTAISKRKKSCPKSKRRKYKSSISRRKCMDSDSNDLVFADCDVHLLYAFEQKLQILSGRVQLPSLKTIHQQLEGYSSSNTANMNNSVVKRSLLKNNVRRFPHIERVQAQSPAELTIDLHKYLKLSYIDNVKGRGQ